MSEICQAPIVSIISLTYNHAPYIRECIDGFLMQKTDFPFEVIIHDDASTDGTTDIIREYATKYPEIIKPIIQTENQYSKHRDFNKILQVCYDKSKGKYIAMCEGDDYWIDPLKLQKQVDFLESHPDYVLVHTGFNFRIGSKIIKRYSQCTSSDVLRGLLANQYGIGTLTVVYRAAALNDISHLYRNKSFKMGDLPLWIELAHVGKVKFIDEVSSVYRVLSDSASHSKDISKRVAFLNDAYAIREFYCKAFHINGIDLNLQKYVSLFMTAFLYNDTALLEKTFSEMQSSGYKVRLKYKLIYYIRNIRFLNEILKKFMGYKKYLQPYFCHFKRPSAN